MRTRFFRDFKEFEDLGYCEFRQESLTLVLGILDTERISLHETFRPMP